MKDPLEDENISEPEDEDSYKDAGVPVSYAPVNGYSWNAWAKMDSRLSGHDLRLRQTGRCHAFLGRVRSFNLIICLLFRRR